MSKRSCYVKSFDSILFLGAFIGVSQFSLANSKCLSRFSSILFIPFLAAFIYLSLASYHFNTSEMLQEEVVILSYGIWTVFCVNLLATLSRFPYYFAVRCLFKRVILDVNEINKRLRMQPKYTKNTLKMWMVFFVFTSANAMVRWCADMHWSIKLAIFAGNLMYYCENMFAYKILNEMALQCERIHALMFEGLQFVQDEHNRQLKVQEQHAQQKEYRVAYLEKFQDLTQIHLEICQCAKKANNLFGAPIMSLFILDFAVVTLTLYDVCNGIVDLDLTTYDQLQLFMILGNCLQIVIIFARIIISIYSWTHLDKKLKETVLNVHKLWNILSINNQIGKWAGCIQLTTIQLSNAIPQFSASGIVDIDWPAIISIISAASTYVVILIQFGSIKRHIVSGEAGGGAPPSQTILFPA